MDYILRRPAGPGTVIESIRTLLSTNMWKRVDKTHNKKTKEYLLLPLFTGGVPSDGKVVKEYFGVTSRLPKPFILDESSLL